jgi:hypothetical protein
MLPVDEDYRHHRQKKDATKKCGSQPVGILGGHEEANAPDQFTQGITHGNLLAAMTTASPQQEIAEERKFLPGTDGNFAVRAMGAGTEEGKSAGKSPGHDIQKAAQRKSEEEEKEERKWVVVAQGNHTLSSFF